MAEVKEYSAKIVTASRELSVREKIQLKDLTDTFKLGDMLDMSDGKKFKLEALEDYVVIDVHNEKSKNKDYRIYQFITKAGERYITSSESCWKSFNDIVEELAEAGEDIDGIDLIFSSHPSKSQQNNFLKCSLG